MDRDIVEKIVIFRVNEGNHFKTTAKIHSGTEVRTLVLGNVDHFLESLEKS